MDAVEGGVSDVGLAPFLFTASGDTVGGEGLEFPAILRANFRKGEIDPERLAEPETRGALEPLGVLR
jgi:hypothetical protein